MNADVQKGETHEATEDATTSPANERNLPGLSPEPAPGAPPHHIEMQRDPETGSVRVVDSADLVKPGDQGREDKQELFPPDVTVRRDDSDLGGPIVIETNDCDGRKL